MCDPLHTYKLPTATFRHLWAKFPIDNNEGIFLVILDPFMFACLFDLLNQNITKNITCDNDFRRRSTMTHKLGFWLNGPVGE